jgi:hypothetical protein
MSTVGDPGQMPDFEPYLDAIFGGTESPTGKHKKSCEDNKGSIRGIGPKCSLHEEEGAQDTAMCHYDSALDLIRDLRELVHPKCQQLVEENLKENPNEALIQQLTEEIDEAKKQFDKDIKKLVDKCECKDCSWDVTTGKPPTETEDPADVDDPPPIDPDIDGNRTTQVLGTSSNYGIIPRVFGRYVTAGIIIWVGNQQSEEITYTKQLNDGEVEVIEDVVETIDMLVGLAVGPLSRVMRIWIGEALVYNVAVNIVDGQVELTSTNNASTDMNITALLSDDYDMERLAAFKPTVEFFPGDKAQHTINSYATEEGFGRTPAHRGLATLLFRDIDLRLFGGDLPDIRVDVIANEPEDILPEINNELEGALQTIDMRTLMAVVVDGDDIVLADYNTLEERYRYEAAAPDAVLSLVSGATVIQAGVDTDVIDVYRDKEIASTSAGTMGPASAAFLGYDSSLFSYDFALLVDADGSFDILRYDYSNKEVSVVGSVSADVGYTTHDGVIATLSGLSVYYKFSLNGGGTNLRIQRYALTDANNVVDTTPTVSAFDLAGTYTNVQAILDNNDGNLILLTDRLSKLDKDTLEVLWETDPVDIPLGISALIAVSPYYYFINTDDEVVRVTLADGTLEVVTDIGGYLLDGAQFFDGNTGSITFDADSGQIVRIFPDRYVAAPTSVGAIFDGLIEATQMGYGLLDTSDVQDVTLKGFYIDSAVNLPSVFNTFGELFQITITDNGRKLFATKEISVGSTTAIDPDDIIADSLKTERQLAAEKFEVATAKFYDIDDFGLVEMNQAVTLRPDTDDPSYESVDFSMQVYDDATVMRQRLEKVLLRRIAAASKIEANFMPRRLGFSPGDRISTNAETYRLGEITDGATIETAVKGVTYDPQDIETDAELTASPIYSELTVVKPSGQLPYKPIVLFTNAVNDIDASRALENQIVYVGIDGPVRTGLEDTQFTLRMDPPGAVQGTVNVSDTGTLYDPVLGLPPSDAFVTPVLNEGVHIGEVTVIPANILPQQFVDDMESELVIVFDHADTVDYFYDGDDVLEHPQRNLLIVGDEMIQFGAYEVDMDGRTVTFTRLYRGRFGTEPYMTEHVTGETAYLYTPETLKPMAVDETYTVRRARARAIIPRAAMLGSILVPWMMITDGGSSRPYGPSPLYRQEIEDLIFAGAIGFHTRRSFSVPLYETGGDLPYRWPYDLGDELQHEGVILVALNRMPTSLAEWETEFEAKYYAQDNSFDPTLIYQWNRFDDTNPIAVGDLSTDTRDASTQPVYVAVMQLRTYVDAQGFTSEILGYPTFWAFPTGNYPPYVAP